MPKRFRGFLFVLASLLGEASRARAAGAKPLQPERARCAEIHPTPWAFLFFAFGQSREAVTESIGRDARVRENLDGCCSVTGLTFRGSQELELGCPGKVKSNYLFL